LHRYLAVTYYLGGCTAAIIVFWQRLLEAATRGEGTERLLNLNGRLPLWQLALREIRTVGETFLGLGLGSSRATLSKEVGFAGQSHNSVIETIIGTGVIGLVLWLAWLSWLGYRSRARRLPRSHPKPFQAAFSALLTLLLILGLISPELASPGYSYSLLGLLAVFVLQRPAERVPEGPGTPTAVAGRTDSAGRGSLVPV
jgi:O-antigen ligase